MNRIEELEKELKLLRGIEELKNKPKFEVGKWYKNGCFLGRITSCSNEDFKFYGFNAGGAWRDDDYYSFVDYSLRDKNTREATNEEVQTALIKEAEKLGFKEGVKFELIEGKTGSINYDRIIDYEFRYIHQQNELVIQMLGASYTIFKNGKWATIIEKPLTINGKKVEITDTNVIIGCKTIDVSDFTNFVKTLQRLNITDFNHPEVGNVTTKQFQEIVDNIE